MNRLSCRDNRFLFRIFPLQIDKIPHYWVKSNDSISKRIKRKSQIVGNHSNWKVILWKMSDIRGEYFTLLIFTFSCSQVNTHLYFVILCVFAWLLRCWLKRDRKRIFSYAHDVHSDEIVTFSLPFLVEPKNKYSFYKWIICILYDFVSKFRTKNIK